jgi:hypothetical protein
MPAAVSHIFSSFLCLPTATNSRHAQGVGTESDAVALTFAATATMCLSLYHVSGELESAVSRSSENIKKERAVPHCFGHIDFIHMIDCSISCCFVALLRRSPPPPRPPPPPRCAPVATAASMVGSVQAHEVFPIVTHTFS